MADENGTAPKFNHEQYELLCRCSAKKEIREWNEWRRNNPTVEIFLEGHQAKFEGAKLKGAHLDAAHLKKANFEAADLREAILWQADLNGTNLTGAKLQRASLCESYLRRARIQSADIRGAKFILAEVDGVSLISNCKFDSETDFTGVGLDSARIDPELKTSLKNNIRRIHWRKWVKIESTRRQRLSRKLVDMFWQLSDYGSSTGRIIGWFFTLAVAFGVLYWIFAMLPGSPSIISELKQVDGQQAFGCIHTLARSIYFSIVTMTTLGFGDMHATTTGGWKSGLGYLFLSFQVIMGYVLLGALVTRLGILFTSEAPAAEPRLTNEQEEKIDE